MSARHELPSGHSLRVTATAGDVTIIAEERPDILVPDGARAEVRTTEERPEKRHKRRSHKRKTLRFLGRLVKEVVHGELLYGGRSSGPVLEIRSPRGGSRDIEVRCPAGIPVSVGTISGDVRLVGDFGAATITTTSGDVAVSHAAALDARSISGRLEVDRCTGLCRLNTKSGHIKAGDTGPAEATTVSGRINLRSTAGGVSVRTISGSVELGTDGTDSVTIRTVSGRVAVKVSGQRLPDARLHSLSGKIDCECPQGSDFALDVTSVSGRIEVDPS